MFVRPALLALSTLCITACILPPNRLPRFETRPEQLKTSSHPEYLELTEAFVFLDAGGARWLAPVGTLTDGASIPQIFLSFIGDRFDPDYRAAALVHDAFCQEINEGGVSYRTRPWRDTHKMFYEACVAGGTGRLKAQLMFAAVWLAGPRWGEEEVSLAGVPQDLLKEEFEKCRTWLETRERSNEELIEWMEYRDSFLRAGESPELTEAELQ